MLCAQIDRQKNQSNNPTTAECRFLESALKTKPIYKKRGLLSDTNDNDTKFSFQGYFSLKLICSKFKVDLFREIVFFFISF